MKTRWLGAVLVAWALFVGGCCVDRPVKAPARLFQVATLQALMEGVYDGAVTCDELKRHGDFGIGTFHALDGEMIMLDGQVYQVKADGKVCRPPGGTTTPFADVVAFASDKVVPLAGEKDLAALQKALDEALPTRNIFYAVRIDGRFAYVKTRSVPAQTPPYPPLVEVTKAQSTFEYRDVEGTIIGFRCPEFSGGVNMPGWHLHFISGDRARGGHLLALSASDASAQLQSIRQLLMVLPDSEAFSRAKPERTSSQELHQAER